MGNLSPVRILEVWESTLGQSPSNRALSLLSLAHANQELMELAQLSVGERDLALMNLRQTLFGPTINGIADCPRCGDKVELTFDLADLARNREHPVNGDPSAGTVRAEGFEISFRLPNTVDLQAVESVRQTSAAREILLRRCIQACQREDGSAFEISQLPEAALKAVASRMSSLDASGGGGIDICCPVCQHEWAVVFDVATYLSRELSAWARRLLREVHLLARAYGWAERDILAMAPLRRRAYLDLLGQS